MSTPLLESAGVVNGPPPLPGTPERRRWEEARRRSSAPAAATAEAEPTSPGVAAEPLLADDVAGTAPVERFVWLTAAPSWLLSLIVHLAGILVLAMIVIAEPLAAVVVLSLDPTREAPIEVESFAIEIERPAVEVDEVFSQVDLPEVLPTDAGLESLVSADLWAVDADLSLDGALAINSAALFGHGGAALTAVDSGGKGAKFFGVAATGRKFVFIVDASGSMRGGKFTAACDELMYALRQLSPEQYYYVIFFDNKTMRLWLPNEPGPAERAIAATTENLRRTKTWVDDQAPGGGTYPHDSVKFALEMLPDAIYLLSDGQFSDGGKTERYLEQENRLDDPAYGSRAKVIIHTICFFEREAEPTLRKIAGESGGTYRFVERGRPVR